VYAGAGTYSVTLTVTNASGSDSVTHDVTVQAVGTPDPEAPAGVLLEIYAASPGSARWDVAKWDVDEWSGAGWQDVTPYGVHVNITWGSPRGDQGILSVPDAASWTVDYFDPDRILDPANESGPYFGDLKPYLPIRVSHREIVIRQGIVTGISHSFARSQRNGYMRGADNITILANAMVPSDTTLSDTLYARAVDAIAAAGLTVSVAAPIGTDPPVSPWVTGEREWSVWQWIKDAAQEVLYIPIIDRLGTVTFRPWASPLTRGRTINSPELLDMQDVTDYSGQYSVVQATDDMDVVTERRLTPTPAYGARTFARTEPTLDPGDWADAVLADRALPGLLWLPGDVYPLTAVSLESYALLEAVELVSMSLPEQSPPVFASGIVVGGEIDIIGRAQDQQGVWRFNFQTAQTATEPLIETGGEPTDYLLRTGGGEYLYPTGGA
jgi:PKD repeat protein